jgi:hypothetical protein
VSQTITCPVGKILLGGGARVTTNGAKENIALTESYPSASNAWTAVGTVTGPIGSGGKKLFLDTYAVCSA